MEAVTFKPDLVVGTFKTGDFRGYVYGLIVDYHTDDVEARFAVWQLEVTRLIDKDAQRYIIHGFQNKKERVAGRESCHSRGVLSPHPGDPHLMWRSVISVSNLIWWRKAAREKSFYCFWTW